MAAVDRPQRLPVIIFEVGLKRHTVVTLEKLLSLQGKVEYDFNNPNPYRRPPVLPSLFLLHMSILTQSDLTVHLLMNIACQRGTMKPLELI